MQLIAGLLVQLGVDDEKRQLARHRLDKINLFRRKVAWPERLYRNHTLQFIGADMEALGAEQHDWHRQDGSKWLLVEHRLAMKPRLALNIIYRDRVAFFCGHTSDAFANANTNLANRRII